jgi:transposase
VDTEVIKGEYMSTMIKTRKKYDEEFKKDAVRLLISSGRKPKDVAVELGVALSVLGRWRREHLMKLDSSTKDTGIKASEMEEEIRRLRKELAYAQEQRDILKKACGILSDRPERGTP